LLRLAGGSSAAEPNIAIIATRCGFVDLTALLSETTQIREVPVWIKGIACALRLVIQPLPPEAATCQRARRIRKANRDGRTIDPRTIQAAGFLMLLTSLAADAQPAERITALYERITALYGHRWQVEIGFKRLKTLGQLDELPSADPVLARTWLLAQLIAAVLTDDLANEIVGFPPSAR
jgi:Transposase DDE domain